MPPPSINGIFSEKKPHVNIFLFNVSKKYCFWGFYTGGAYFVIIFLKNVENFILGIKKSRTFAAAKRGQLFFVPICL